MDAKKNRLDDYIVTIQELELVTGESIPVDEYLKFEKLEDVIKDNYHYVF